MSIDDDRRTDMQSVIDAARDAATPAPLDDHGRFFVALTRNGDYAVIDVEAQRTALLDRPRRKTGSFAFAEAASLIDYVGRHGTGDTELWADLATACVVAVVNGHGSEPGHGDHRATLTLRHTPGWLAWAGRDRRMLGQVEFAEHVEDRLIDILRPPAADMLELVQTFTAKRELAFESSKALSTGQVQLEYRETLAAQAGHKGRLEIPQRFALALSPYEGCDPIEISARLRYRIADGALKLGYFLDRPEDVLREAFNSLVGAIRESVAAPLFLGTPSTQQ